MDRLRSFCLHSAPVDSEHEFWFIRRQLGRHLGRSWARMLSVMSYCGAYVLSDPQGTDLPATASRKKFGDSDQFDRGEELHVLPGGPWLDGIVLVNMDRQVIALKIIDDGLRFCIVNPAFSVDHAPRQARKLNGFGGFSVGTRQIMLMSLS